MHNEMNTDFTAWFDPAHWESLCHGPVQVNNRFSAQWLPQLSEHYPLNATARLLLAADGSVTRMLEAIAQQSLSVNILYQEDHPASGWLANLLPQHSNATVRVRLVEICAGDAILCYAGSILALSQLPHAMQTELHTTNLPIGRLFERHGLPLLRYSSTADVARPRMPLPLAPSMPPGPYLVRDSYLVLGQENVIEVRECIPLAIAGQG